MSRSEQREIGIPCPNCGGDSHVIDSRSAPRSRIRRRRKCMECFDRFTTYESYADSGLEGHMKSALKQLEAIERKTRAATKFVQSVLRGDFDE